MKLVVCDIDGTIVDSPRQKLPSDEFIETIQDIKEHALVTCATGRALTWALPVLKAAKFTAPCIIGGGTIILDPVTFETIHAEPLPHNQFENIKAILKRYPHYKVLFNDYSEEEFYSGGWPLQKLLDADSCYLMEINDLPENLADELINTFNKLENVQAVKISPPRKGMNVQLVHKNATKEDAIRFIQQLLGISRQDTTGIGDGHNDFHIFNAVETKVAVDNAVPDLKDLADIVIGDVKDDAVTEYLRNLVK
jgi:HAD superfamily hydrolase (TIGR01484 family)